MLLVRTFSLYVLVALSANYIFLLASGVVSQVTPIGESAIRVASGKSQLAARLH